MEVTKESDIVSILSEILDKVSNIEKFLKDSRKEQLRDEIDKARKKRMGIDESVGTKAGKLLESIG